VDCLKPYLLLWLLREHFVQLFCVLAVGLLPSICIMFLLLLEADTREKGDHRKNLFRKITFTADIGLSIVALKLH